MVRQAHHERRLGDFVRRLGDFEKSLICYLLPLLPAHFLLRHIKAPSVVWSWVTPTSPEGGFLFQPFPSPVFSFPKIRDDSGLSEFSPHSVSCRGEWLSLSCHRTRR